MFEPTIRPAAQMPLVVSLLIVSASLGCTAAHEDALRADLRASSFHRDEAPDPGPPREGRLEEYVAYAGAAHPSVRAAHARWRAAVHRIAPARRVPDPTVTYAFYAAPVQTRVGPQRHRLGVRQAIPWPTRLTAAADVQGHAARAAQRRFEARLLALRAPVAEAWWRLWAIRRGRAIHRERAVLLDAIAEAARARLAVGTGTLAHVGALDLARSRQRDRIDALDEAEVHATARLRAAIAAPVGLATPTADAVDGAALPVEGDEALRAALADHPDLEAWELMARAHEAEAGAVEAGRFPSFVLGVDWIETGDAASPSTPGSGDDALMVSVGVSIPIFGQGAADDLQRAAEAEARADRLEREGAELAAVERLHHALGDLRETQRRLHLYDATLSPQARSVYEAVAGDYATGQASVADVLLAIRELLEIQLEAVEARARHGVAWARLEALVGRPVARAPSADDSAEEEVSR